jgi:hypothetical protein
MLGPPAHAGASLRARHCPIMQHTGSGAWGALRKGGPLGSNLPPPAHSFAIHASLGERAVCGDDVEYHLYLRF